MLPIGSIAFMEVEAGTNAGKNTCLDDMDDVDCSCLTPNTTAKEKMKILGTADVNPLR